MKIIRDLGGKPLFGNGVVLALGNFDGVHLGHRAILQECVALSKAHGVPSAVMTFEPHPREFFSREHTPLRLHSLRQKIEHISALGIEHMLLMRFNQKLASTSAESFVDDILFRQLGVKHVVTGYDFAFGKGRAGDGQFLTLKARELNFGFTAHAQINDDKAHIISSSAIRALLAQGKISEATAMLGHGYQITGHVIHGEKRGRSMGFPTLNMSLKKKFKPRFGVYAARVQLAGSPYWFDGVANIGIKPTFGVSEALLEVHCFNMNDDAYGKLARVELLAFIRDEKKFANLDALKTQIGDDAAQAKKLLQEAQ